MVELLVNGQSLDLFQEEIISITKASSDIANINTSDGSYSNKFDVPSTARNASIFGYANISNFAGEFKPTKSNNARITVDGMTVDIGVVQVEQYNNLDNSFSLSFFGGNVDWMDQVGDKNLIDLDFSDLDHEYTKANISSSFLNKSGYIYPFLNYGRLHAETGNSTSIYDWRGALYFHTIVERIFSDIDWKVKGSLLSDPFYLNTVLLNTTDYPELGEDVTLGLGVNYSGVNPTPINTTVTFTNFVSGNAYGNYNDVTGEYTANMPFNATIKASLRVDDIFIGGNNKILINGVTVATANSKWLNPVIYNGLINQGDVITVQYSAQAYPSGGLTSAGYFIVEAFSGLAEGATFPVKSMMPDMSQSDFLKTVFNQFGVIFTVDSISKTVYLNKFSDVKANIYKAIDWTKKVDISKEIETDYTEIVSDYGRVNQYKYKETDDVDNYMNLPQSRIEDIKEGIGNGSFVIDNDFLTKEKVIFETKFSSSSNTPSFNRRCNLLYAPRFSDENQEDLKPNVKSNPRCAQVVRGVSVENIFGGQETSINITTPLGTLGVTDVPFAFFHVPQTGIEKVDLIGEGLSFGNPFFDGSQKGLLTEYYTDYISILNNPRRITLELTLNERDINALDFTIPVYLAGDLNAYFYINKIKDYRPSKNKTSKVELILLT